nr:squamosa promoter-binding-like protein 12 [Tanacetum cinerariifolium]
MLGGSFLSPGERVGLGELSHVQQQRDTSPKEFQFSSHKSQENVVVDNVDFAFLAFTNSSSKIAIKNFEVFDNLLKEFLEKDESSWVEENQSFSNMVEDTSVLSGEAMIGLKLGRHARRVAAIDALLHTM